MMWAWSVILSSSALQSRALGRAWVHSEKGRLVVKITAAFSARRHHLEQKLSHHLEQKLSSHLGQRQVAADLIDGDYIAGPPGSGTTG